MANGKQGSVPTTVFVPTYPSADQALEREEWSRAVAGFCNGSQAVKERDGFLGVRTGSVVYFQGEIVVDSTDSGYLLEIEALPVVPRANGFVNAYASDGAISGLAFTAGSRKINIGGLADGNYYVTGSYIAEVKEKT